MRLLETSTLEVSEFLGSVPEYAILSHRWEDDEVSFLDVIHGRHKARKGWYKVEQCCTLAARAGIKYAWVDTCCIDKSSSAELQEAVNSMYQWYENSRVCHVFMSDVGYEVNETEQWHNEFVASKWFTRGWTLQELLAPTDVQFYDRTWQHLGSKETLYDKILVVTGITNQDFKKPRSASVAKRMSWISKRETTRKEDIAYCMLGLFDVNMPLLYGEGDKAFMRLQQEIIAQSDDESIFAWRRDGQLSGLLAQSPADFQESHNVNRAHLMRRRPYEFTNKGVSITFGMAPFFPDGPQGVKFYIVPLNCTLGDSKAPLCMFLVRHHGIQFSRGVEDPDEAQARRTGPLIETNDLIMVGFSDSESKSHASIQHVFVRQDDEERWHDSHMFSGLHWSYRAPEERSPESIRTSLPNPVWHISDQKLEEERLLAGLQINGVIVKNFNVSNITNLQVKYIKDKLSLIKTASQGAQMIRLDSEDTLASLNRLLKMQEASNGPSDQSSTHESGGTLPIDSASIVPLSDQHVFEDLYRPQLSKTSGQQPNIPIRASATLVGRTDIYVIGGTERTTNKASNDVFRLNLDSKTWDKIESQGSIPEPRMCHSATLWQDKKIIVFGGQNNQRQFFSDLVVFDTETATWTAPELNGPAPQARSRHSALIHDEKLYIIGGLGAKNSTLLGEMCYLDLQTLTWSTTYPCIPHIDHHSWIWDHQLWLYGGLAEIFHRYRKICNYDMTDGSLTTTTIPLFPQPQRLTALAEGMCGYLAAPTNILSTDASSLNEPPSPPEGSQNANMCARGNHFYTYTSGKLYDFRTPSVGRAPLEQALSVLDMENLRWEPISIAAEFFQKGYKWPYTVANAEGTKVWLLGCLDKEQSVGGGSAEETLSDVLEIDITKLT